MGQEMIYHIRGMQFLPGLIAATNAGFLLILLFSSTHPNIESVVVYLFGGENHSDLLGIVENLSCSLGM